MKTSFLLICLVFLVGCATTAPMIPDDEVRASEHRAKMLQANPHLPLPPPWVK